MLGSEILRFLIVIVSAFAVAGDYFDPKTVSGIFGAAPSIALAMLGLTYAQGGPVTRPARGAP